MVERKSAFVSDAILGLSDATGTQFVVDAGSCNDSSITELDLSGFEKMERFEVGDDCFECVNELRLIGLRELESVVVGMSCFTKNGDEDPNRRFLLKNCLSLRELRIGCYSFSDYTVCELANLDALEVITMGEMNTFRSLNFSCASLELKSILIHNE